MCIFVLTETKTLQTREASCLDNTGSKWTVCNPEPEQLPRQHAPAGSCRLPRRNKASLNHRKRVCLFPCAHWLSSSSSFLLTPSPLSLALSLRGAVTTPRRRFRCVFNSSSSLSHTPSISRSLAFTSFPSIPPNINLFRESSHLSLCRASVPELRWTERFVYYPMFTAFLPGFFSFYHAALTLSDSGKGILYCPSFTDLVLIPPFLLAPHSQPHIVFHRFPSFHFRPGFSSSHPFLHRKLLSFC